MDAIRGRRSSCSTLGGCRLRTRGSLVEEQEVGAFEAAEVAIEGDEATPSCLGAGGEIGVGPQSRSRPARGGPVGEDGLGGFRLGKEQDLGESPQPLVVLPCLTLGIEKETANRVTGPV